MRRVLVAAASPVVRAGLEALLAGASLTVVGTTAGVAALADAVEGAEADVVLVAADRAADLPLPLRLAPDAAARVPALVLLADEGDPARLADLLRAGVRAVLPRTASPDEIVAAVEAAAAGLVSLPADVAEGVLRSAPARSDAARGAPPTPGQRQPLSPRETQILGLLAEGLPNKLVAARLGISEHTVKTHVAAILEKLGAGTRAEAVAIGARRGMILL